MLQKILFTFFKEGVKNKEMLKLGEGAGEHLAGEGWVRRNEIRGHGGISQGHQTAWPQPVTSSKRQMDPHQFESFFSISFLQLTGNWGAGEPRTAHLKTPQNSLPRAYISQAPDSMTSGWEQGI